MDLWNKKGRVYWKEDTKYLEFQENILFNTYFSFDEVFDFCPLTKLLDISETQKTDMKKEWLKLSEFWNNNSNPPCSYGIAFLVAVLPFNEITNINIISEFEMKQINIIHHYNYDKDLNYTGAIAIANRGPIFPPAFLEWMDDGFNIEYNTAIWWINYCMYERINELDSLEEFISTKKL